MKGSKLLKENNINIQQRIYNSKMAQAICSKCFQLMDAKAFEEHQKTKCFPLMLKAMDITIRTTVPVNVLAYLLERIGIQVRITSFAGLS